MITANNLLKAGFVPGEKMPLDGKNWYRDWDMVIRGELSICVCEQSDGTISAELTMAGKYSHLNITSVTDLLTLAKLLK